MINKDFKITDLFKTIYETKKNEKEVKVSDILFLLEEKGFFLLILMFSLILIIPAPPPIGIICVLINIFFLFQMIIGSKRVWLPNFISKRKIKQNTFSFIMTKSINIISKLEKITKKDRYFFVKTPFMEKLFVFILLFICIFSLIPIIFINTLQGISIILICFGILNRDGLFIIIGFLFVLISAISVYYTIIGIREIVLSFILKKIQSNK